MEFPDQHSKLQTLSWKPVQEKEAGHLQSAIQFCQLALFLLEELYHWWIGHMELHLQ